MPTTRKWVILKQVQGGRVFLTPDGDWSPYVSAAKRYDDSKRAKLEAVRLQATARPLV